MNVENALLLTLHASAEDFDESSDTITFKRESIVGVVVGIAEMVATNEDIRKGFLNMAEDIRNIKDENVEEIK